MRKRIQAFLFALGLGAVLLAPSSIAAPLRTGIAATTGLLSVMPGRLVTVRVSDVGARPNVFTIVQLDILDGANRILATRRGELRPGQPLELDFRYDGSAGPRLPVRARTRVFHPGALAATVSRPILSFEIANPDTGEVNVGLTCPFPGGGGFEFNCTCFFDDLTAPAPSLP